MGQVAAEPDTAVGAVRGADQIEGTGAAVLLAFGLGVLVGDFDSYHGHG